MNQDRVQGPVHLCSLWKNPPSDLVATSNERVKRKKMELGCNLSKDAHNIQKLSRGEAPDPMKGTGLVNYKARKDPSWCNALTDSVHIRQGQRSTRALGVSYNANRWSDVNVDITPAW